MNYKNTQFSPFFFGIGLIMTTFFVYLYKTEGVNMPFVLVLQFVVIFLLFSFSFLTVSVDDNELKIKFGQGIYKKILKTNDIVSTTIVRNKWYYGWGIRYRFKPFITIFNVSGLDAVEFKTKEGKIFRIGTNEPKKLHDTISKSIVN